MPRDFIANIGQQQNIGQGRPKSYWLSGPYTILFNLMHSIGSHPYGARCLKVGGVYGIHEQESLANAR